jgi:UDP-N-acetyl-D-mannosaminuronate dehydrogenase
MLRETGLVRLPVAHRQFREMSIEKICNLMNDTPVFIDVRGIFDPKTFEKNMMYYRKL